MLRPLIAAAIVLVALPAQAKTSRWSKIDHDTTFRGWRRELQHVVDREGRARLNHFCLIVQTVTPDRGIADPAQPPDVTVAHVLWRERHEVLEWDGVDSTGRMQSVPGADVLDMRKDFKPTVEDLHGSTYQETVGWLKSVERHCARLGTSVTIRSRGRDQGPFRKPRPRSQTGPGSSAQGGP